MSLITSARTFLSVKSQNTRPALSTTMVIRFSVGMASSLVLLGVSTATASSGRNCAVSMKKVTSRNARSTIGVMSSEGLLRGILILGILLLGLDHGQYHATHLGDVNVAPTCGSRGSGLR